MDARRRHADEALRRCRGARGEITGGRRAEGRVDAIGWKEAQPVAVRLMWMKKCRMSTLCIRETGRTGTTYRGKFGDEHEYQGRQVDGEEYGIIVRIVSR